MKLTSIITAGGIGKRMGAEIPKQFLEIAGKPLLMHTIQVFYDFDPKGQLLVTLPKDWWAFWKELCEKHQFLVEHELVEGGVERFDSIQNALEKTTGEIVLVHDGVRPLVSHELIERVKMSVVKYGTGVPMMPLKESIRKGSMLESKVADRSSFFSVQTPQGFMCDIIQKSYNLPYESGFTDDASVVEKSGHLIAGVEGESENIKITVPFDIKVAEAVMVGDMY
jgi:2-C-methyl-D-erythritol 4-phosphate cytidylyltransferase